MPSIISEIRAGQGTLMDGAEPWAGGGVGREIWQLEGLGMGGGKGGCPQDWGRNGSPQRAASFVAGREMRGETLQGS